MVDAGRPALEPADDDQVGQRRVAASLARDLAALAAIDRVALAGTGAHRLVGGVGRGLDRSDGRAGGGRHERDSVASPRRRLRPGADAERCGAGGVTRLASWTCIGPPTSASKGFRAMTSSPTTPTSTASGCTTPTRRGRATAGRSSASTASPPGPTSIARWSPPLTAAGHRVVCPDLAGFGRSDKPTERGWYSYDRHVELVSALLESLDLHDAVAVVQDWGGPIGLRWAVENADRVSALVILNTGLFTGRVSKGFMAWREFAEKNPDLPVGFILQGGRRPSCRPRWSPPMTPPSRQPNPRRGPPSSRCWCRPPPMSPWRSR